MDKPTDEDCCHSDCRNCIFDVYEKHKHQHIRDIFESGENALSLIQYRPFILVRIDGDSLHTNVYTFIPEGKGIGVYYNPGQHAVLKHVISSDTRNNNDESPSETRLNLSRAYTLIPWDHGDHPGSFSVVVKLYDGGKMSSVIRQWALGDICFWRGPYNGAGSWTYQPNRVKSIIMICMGTGIAPMFALARSITENEDDETCVRILYASRTPGEIVLRKHVRELCKFWNVACTHFLSEGFNEADKKFDEIFVRGRIRAENIAEVYRQTGNLEALVCGSDEFNASMKDALLSIGVTEEEIIIFS